MRATLIYNPKAGKAGSEEDLVSRLADIGWTVDRCLPKQRLADCLTHGVDVVVVAGGDGTVARVAKRLAGTDLPLAIVPTGTANNVARSLGIHVDPSSAVGALVHATERRVDLGVVRTRMARDYFLEGFGLGVFAYVIAEKAQKKDKKLRKALGLLAHELEGYEPTPVELEVDGRDLSGTYVLAAAMNARSLGPALGVAPEARCDDGELDVVLIRPEARRALVRHLRRAVATEEEEDVELPAFETVPARQVRVRADGRWAHVDDAARQLEGDTFIDVAAGAVRLLAPPQASRDD